MSEVSAEMLSAYHDQELGLEETSRLRRSLAADAGARALVDSFGRIDDAVRESFAEELDAPESLALARSCLPQPAKVFPCYWSRSGVACGGKKFAA